MAEEKRITVFEVLVYLAYSFYILIGLAWLTMSFVWWHAFDYRPLIIIGIFGAQAWLRHKLTNLILGILTLPICIFGTLEFIYAGQQKGFIPFVQTMLCLSVVGIIMSGFLVFGYMKLSFKDR
jgi:hypothetical protein